MQVHLPNTLLFETFAPKRIRILTQRRVLFHSQEFSCYLQEQLHHTYHNHLLLEEVSPLYVGIYIYIGFVKNTKSISNYRFCSSYERWRVSGYLKTFFVSFIISNPLFIYHQKHMLDQLPQWYCHDSWESVCPWHINNILVFIFLFFILLWETNIFYKHSHDFSSQNFHSS